jgi:hypothetical protein
MRALLEEFVGKVEWVAGKMRAWLRKIDEEDGG